MQQRVTILRAGPEATERAILGGFVNTDLLRHCEAVTAENHHLRAENEHVTRLNVVLAAKLEEYQTTHRLVLDGQMRRRRMWRWYKPNLMQGVVIGLVAGFLLVSAVFALVIWLV